MGLFDKLFSKKAVDPTERRLRNNNYIKMQGINCLETLPVIESSSEAKLKDIDTICKRAIACLISIQLSCDLRNPDADINQSLEICNRFIDAYGVRDYLLDIEKRLYNNTYTEQDINDMDWAYEDYWALLWALGLIDDIKDASIICDCQKAIDITLSCKTYQEFRNKCKLRNIEEILDMLDLYYRYHWACVEKRINNNGSIGNLDPEVVVERRRGLEWLISPEKDWYDIPLHT